MSIDKLIISTYILDNIEYKMYKTFASSEFNFYSTKTYIIQFNKLYDAISEHDYEDDNPHLTARKILGGYGVFKAHSASSFKTYFPSILTSEYNRWKSTQLSGWTRIVQHKNTTDKHGQSHLRKMDKILTFLKSIAENDPTLDKQWKVILHRTALESLIVFNEAVSHKNSKYNLQVFVKKQKYTTSGESIKECDRMEYCIKRGYLQSTFDAYRKAKYNSSKLVYNKTNFRFKLREKK